MTTDDVALKPGIAAHTGQIDYDAIRSKLGARTFKEQLRLEFGTGLFGLDRRSYCRDRYH